MNQLLARQVEEVLSGHRSGLASEAPLRAAAATLGDAPPGVIRATTVVGVLGQDDIAAFERLVAGIADEYGLDTRIQLQVGSFSVRFSRSAPEAQ
jgi:hypothetical protein